MENMKDYIKKIYNGISPAGSNEDFVNTILRKAEVMNRIDIDKTKKNNKTSENTLTEKVNVIEEKVLRKSGRNSLTVAACLALSLVIGAGVFLANTDFLTRPEEQYAADGGSTETVYEDNILPTDYKLAFDNIYGNAELLHDALNVPKYEVLENTFENIDFEIVSVIGDDNGMLNIIIDAVAKNGFKFDVDVNYAGIAYSREKDKQKREEEWGYKILSAEVDSSGNSIKGELMGENVFVKTPEKLTFILDGSINDFGYNNLSGNEIVFYINEFWIWAPDVVIPNTSDEELTKEQYDEWLQENTEYIPGLAQIKLNLNYNDIGAIKIDVNQTANLVYNNLENGEAVGSVEESIKSICLTPMSFVIKTENKIALSSNFSNNEFYSISLRMKNGHILTSNKGYFMNISESILPQIKDFGWRGGTNSFNIVDKYHDELYSFQNLIDLSEVEAIILGDLEIPVNVSDDGTANEDAITSENDYTNVFDNVYGNSELIQDAVNAPEYKVLENTFENIDFEVVGVVGDENGIVSIVIDAVAKNGFEFEAGEEYRYAGLTFGIDNTYNPWEFKLTPPKGNYIEGYDRGMFSTMEYLSITPEKLTFMLDGSTFFHEFINQTGNKATFYLEEIWYWIPDFSKEFIKPESKDPNHEVSIQEDTNIIEGRVKLEVDLNYNDIEVIELDVNQNVELGLNSRKNNGETVSSIEETIESIRLTPMSITIKTLNNVLLSENDEQDVFYSIGLKMKNGDIFTSNIGYVIDGIKSFDTPRSKDFELRGTSNTGDSEDYPFFANIYRNELYSFYNLIDLNEVEAIILGDLEIPVNASDAETDNEDVANSESNNDNVFADAFGNYELLDGMTNAPEYEVVEDTFENIDFEIAGVVGDENGSVHIVVDAIAKNGFEFDVNANYTSGLYIERSNPEGWRENDFPLTVDSELVDGLDDGTIGLECLSVKPDKVTFLHSYKMNLLDNAELRGEEAIMLSGEILYGDLYFPDDINSEDLNVNQLYGFVQIKLLLNYEDIGKIKLDVNQNVDLNYKDTSGEIYSAETFVKSICLTPLSFMITTDKITEEATSYYDTLSIRMKNGDVINSCFNNFTEYSELKDFELRSSHTYSESREYTNTFLFQNLIDLNEVDKIILGDFAILLN